MAFVSRRNFLQVAGAAGAVAALVACDTTTPEETPADEGSATAPADEPADESVEPEEPTGPEAIIHEESEYPIDPDGSDVEALWTSEVTLDNWTRVTADGAPELGVWDASKIIQVDGLAFKDMNGNGKLDPYEDWRQPHDVRAAALAEMMDYNQAMLLMWHGGDESWGGDNSEPHGLCVQGSRAGVSRKAADRATYAEAIEWINEVQAVCEDSDFGVPYLNSTDQYQLFDIPDNVALAACMDKDVWRKAGMWLGRAWRATGVRCLLGPQVDVYSQIVGCRLSGSVCEDPAINRDFTAAFSGGMQSTWADDEATEDLGWGKDSCAAMLKHYVGEGCSEGGRNDHNSPGAYNVFPGDNFDAHLIPFLDGGLNLDSVTGEMAAVMPCYGVAFDEDEKYGENVGSGYNKRNLMILRNAGWDGMYTTDWGILTSQIYGVQDLTETERYAKMIEASVDQYGGGFEPDIIDSTFELLKEHLGEDEALARVRDSARRICKVMMDVDLFENPYSDHTVASVLFKQSDAADAFGVEASEKCTVMLKNHDNVIKEGGITGKPKAYIPQKKFGGGMFSSSEAYFATCIDEDIASEYFDIVTDEIVDNAISRVDTSELSDCDYAILLVNNPKDPNSGVSGGSGMGMQTGVEYLPITLQYRTYTADTAREVSIAGDLLEDGTRENRSYKGKSQTASNESDLDWVISVREALPEKAKLILIVEASNPMCFYEIEPYADVILMSYVFAGSPSSKGYANIVCGITEPSGLSPFQQPKDMETVEASYEDVPRDVEPYEDSDGNVYDFCFGLNWSGQIKDERYEKYSVAPLTEPETEVIPG